MSEYSYITLREKPKLIEYAAQWFHSKWECQKKPILNVWNHI